MLGHDNIIANAAIQIGDEVMVGDGGMTALSLVMKTRSKMAFHRPHHPAIVAGMKKLDIRDSLTEQIIGCIIKVHRALGPGFVEPIYRRALVIELNKHGFVVEAEKQILIYYQGIRIGRHRLDLVVATQ